MEWKGDSDWPCGCGRWLFGERGGQGKSTPTVQMFKQIWPLRNKRRAAERFGSHQRQMPPELLKRNKIPLGEETGASLITERLRGTRDAD